MITDVITEASKKVQKGLSTVHLGSQIIIAIISRNQQSWTSLKYLRNPKAKLKLFKFMSLIYSYANCMSFDRRWCMGYHGKICGTIFNEFLDQTVEARYPDLIYILNLFNFEISLHLNILTILKSNPTTNWDETIQICDPLTLSYKNYGARHNFFTLTTFFFNCYTWNLIVILSFLILY